MLLVVAALLSMTAVVHTVAAADTVATVEAGNVVGMPGETVNVPVYITANAIKCFSVLCEYDAERLTYVGVDFASLGALGYCISVNADPVYNYWYDQGNYASFSWAAAYEAPAASEGLVVAYMQFEIKADAPIGEAYVNISNEGALSYSGHTIYGTLVENLSVVAQGDGGSLLCKNGSVSIIADIIDMPPSAEEDFVIENGVLTEYIGSEKTVVIPSTVTSIAKVAFKDSAVKTVIIPASVETIAIGAFLNCAEMTDAYILGSDTVLEEGCMGFSGTYLPKTKKVYLYDFYYGDEECLTSLLTIHAVPNESVDVYVANGDGVLFDYDPTTPITPFSFESLVVPHRHSMQPATCTSPATCSECGHIGAPALGHEKQPATCFSPAFCSRCMEVFPDPPFGHIEIIDASGAVICAVCGELIKEAPETPIKISGAYLNLTDNVNLFYTATVPEGYEDPYMVFEMNGKSYTVTDYTVRTDGKLSFSFGAIRAQYFGDNIKATLYATYGGVLCSVVKESYSVREYCANQLAKGASNAALVRMVSDLLAYGDAAQIYANYKTNSLSSGTISYTPTVFTQLGAEDNKKALVGVADATVTWKSAGLRLENALALYVRFTTTDAEGLQVRFSVAGKEATVNVSDYTCDASGYYTIFVRGLAATEFGETFTANFIRDGEVIGQTLQYSVNSYVYSNQSNSNSALRDLVRAIANYGSSARIYAGLDHEEIYHEAKAPTCTEAGWYAYVTCAYCDYTTYKENPAFGHDEVFHEGKEATCTESGWHPYVTCTRCDYNTYEAILPLGHDMSDATCSTPAHCSRCNYTEGDALGHYVWVDVVETLDTVTVGNSGKNPYAYRDGWYVTTSHYNGTLSTLTLTAKMACKLVIEYAVSCEIRYDYLTVYVNGRQVDQISGEVSGKFLTVEMKEGDVITFSYWKDGNSSSGTDTARLRIVSGAQADVTKQVRVLETELAEMTCDDVFCSDCGVQLRTASGHVMTEATCTEPATCSRCGHIEGEALGHAMSAATCYTPATCSRCGHEEGEALDHDYSGTTPNVCVNCGYKKLEGGFEGSGDDVDWDLGWHIHDALVHYTKEPTCKTVGYDKYECTVCEYVLYKEIPALGHNVTVATCTEPAACTRCDYVERDPLGHTWKAATCTAPATCAVCGDTEGVALGHDMREATCEAPATCSRCGHTVGTPLGHKMVAASCTYASYCERCFYTVGSALGHDMRAATCEDPSTCSRCKYTDGTPLGHDMSAATCEDPSTCSRCNYTEGVALGHDMRAATCYKPETCLRCGHTVGSALGHNMTEATCLEPSSCTRCIYTVGSALGHDMSEKTCTEDSLCSRCDYVDPALGHAMKDATCTEPATCANCGYTEGRALGHYAIVAELENDPVNPFTVDNGWYVLSGKSVGTTATLTATVYFATTVEVRYTVTGANSVFKVVKNGETLVYAVGTQDVQSVNVTLAANDVVTISFTQNALGDEGRFAVVTMAQVVVGETIKIPAILMLPTCEEDVKCDGCGTVVKTALGHDMSDATCTDPAICSRCGHTEGDALGHDYSGANHNVCVNCGHTKEGDLFGKEDDGVGEDIDWDLL